MPFTEQQLIVGANYTLQTYAKGKPVDQINTERPYLKWLIANKKPSSFGNGVYNEKVRKSNDSNYQNYFGDDQVSYNRRDVVRLAAFNHYNNHDGFGLNEDELAANGIEMTDEKNATVTDAEKIQLVDLLETNYDALREGYQENMNLELLADGTQSATACPGLDLLVSTTPASTTVGGIDCSQAANAYYRNNVSLNISLASAGNLVDKMEIEWRKCVTFGKMAPNAIFVGSDFLDAYRRDAGQTISRQIEGSGNQRGGVSLDASTTKCYFKGVELIWDPTFDEMDSLYSPTEAWSKRCYFLNSKALILRPNGGHWMVNRKPARMYDRYVHYFGMTSKYGLTTPKRNCMSVMTID